MVRYRNAYNLEEWSNAVLKGRGFITLTRFVLPHTRFCVRIGMGLLDCKHLFTCHSCKRVGWRRYVAEVSVTIRGV